MSIPGPTLGPCTPWITGADVAASCSDFSGTDPDGLDAVAVEASMALYEISGRRFTGLCSRIVRPARNGCGCFGGDRASGLGPWWWGANAWGWTNDCGDQIGCDPLSKIRLAGYPVREIVEVKIDGAVLPALDGNGHPNYRLDLWRDLVRMDDPGPPFQRRLWPSCQNMSLEDTEQGTFSIAYMCGVDPPQLGRDAAAQLACALYADGAGTGTCDLPQGVTKVTREGITIDRGILTNWFDPSKSTGMTTLDLFLRGYWATRTGRRPAVFSPDVQRFARRQT